MSEELNTLSMAQMAKRAYDDTERAFKTIPSSNTSFSIELSQSDGDSVLAYPYGQSSTVNVLSTTTPGEIVAPISAVGLKSATLYTKTNATLSTAAVAKIQVSPEDGGSVWVDSGITITSSTVNGTVVLGTSGSIIARRMRVVLVTAPDVNSVDVYLVAQAV